MRVVRQVRDAYHVGEMEESKAQYELGGVASIKPEALGEPGKRTFRIQLQSGAASACLWLEKEQLSELALYLQQILASLPEQERERKEPVAEPEWAGGVASIDFKIGKMSLAHNAATTSFFIVAHDVEEPEDSVPTISFWLSMTQAEELVREALKVCAAGRPRCFLCGRPIDPDGHVCPRANGHAGALEL